MPATRRSIVPTLVGMSGFPPGTPAPPMVPCAFVDAGFLREIGAARLNLRADEVCIVGPRLVGAMGWATPHRLLRTHLYDGRFEPDHQRAQRQRDELAALADTEGLKLRL